MTALRHGKSRFTADDDSSPKVSPVTKIDSSKDLGLSQVDSSFAIGQSGGVVVVLQEFHDESAVDTGDFAVSKSRLDKRRDAQKDREDAMRRKKEDERKAAMALKKEAEARAAREVEAARKAEKKAKEDERRKKDREERQAKKEAKKEAPAPPPPAPEEKAPVVLSEGSKAILSDSAIVGIGNVIKKTTALKESTPSRVLVSTGAQTDPVRILPIIDQQPTSSPATASAAWWLQQGHSSGAVQPSQPSPPSAVSTNPTSSDQFMMQAYIDAMQRQQSSNYGYWTTPQSSAADLYWQQQQSVRYTAPRRV